jgi:hypothetical protein
MTLTLFATPIRKMSEADDLLDGPSFRTIKEVRQLSDHELADCLGEQQFLLDLYANNDQPNDPITQELRANLDRLDDELERRLQAGTFRINEDGSDQAVDVVSVSQRSHVRRSVSESYLFYGTLVAGAAGAVLGYFFHPTPGILGALAGLVVGVCLPGAVLIVLSIAYFIISAIIRLLRNW